MSLTIIFGKPRSGKTTFLAYLVKMAYKKEGNRLWQNTVRKIIAENGKSGREYSFPKKPPIFMDMYCDIHIPTGYKKWFVPYQFNGYYVGLKNNRVPLQYFPPGSKLFYDEAQRYYDARQHGSFPPWVSRFFEMHGHHGLDIYLPSQRYDLIDLNIRALCDRFITILEIKHEYGYTGQICRTYFRCAEFGNLYDVDEYLLKGEKTYRETTYVNEGNIYKYFNSYSCAEEYLPPKGKDFTYLERLGEEEFKKLGSSELSRFYDTAEPYEFRHEPKTKDKQEGKNERRETEKTA